MRKILNLIRSNYKLVVILIVTAVIYLPILNGFFQHDEWSAFINFYLSDQSISLIFKQAFLDTGHFVPFFNLIYGLLLKIFGMDYVLYASISLLSHLFIVYLVYRVSKRIFENDNILTVLVTALFALSASGHQATTWPLVDINIHGATIFALLSIEAILKNNFKYSILFLFISLLFKEIAIGLFIFLPLLYLLHFNKNPRTEKKRISIFVIGGFFYSVLRLILYFHSKSKVYHIVTASSGIGNILINLVTFPFKVFYETVFPPRFLLLISHRLSSFFPQNIAGINGTTQFDQFSEQFSLPLVGILVVLIAGIFFFKNKYKKNVLRSFLIGTSFLILNSFVYALSPDRPNAIPLIDSRNLYFPSIGTYIIITSILRPYLKKKNKLAILFIACLSCLNIFWLNKEISGLVTEAKIRSSILKMIKLEYPVLPNKVVFYFESDRSYYGLAENYKIMPFQTNLGLNIFAWYSSTESFSNDFLNGKKFFLYNLTDEGYREYENRGFGYFWNYENLKEFINQNDFPIESIISFIYDSVSGRLLNNTNSIRSNLE